VVQSCLNSNRFQDCWKLHRRSNILNKAASLPFFLCFYLCRVKMIWLRQPGHTTCNSIRGFKVVNEMAMVDKALKGHIVLCWYLTYNCSWFCCHLGRSTPMVLSANRQKRHLNCKQRWCKHQPFWKVFLVRWLIFTWIVTTYHLPRL